MDKKAQITIFVIIGILILAVIGIIFFIYGGSLQSKLKSGLVEKVTIPKEIVPIKEYIENCLEKTGKEGLFLISKQGGYYKLPKESSTAFSIEFNPYDGEKTPIAFFIELSPYYFYKGQDLVPEISLIEGELSRYIKNNIDECIDNFKSFEDQSYDFAYNDFDISSKILKDRILINADYTLSIQKDSMSFKLNSFSKDFDFDFHTKHNIAKKIIAEQKKDPKHTPLGFITNLAYEENFTFETTNINGEDTLFVLMFDEGLYENHPYIYTFIIKR